jgi:imidazoleglycerol phosphate dehydratase HisB/histidinol-phosphate/aromatic aminotransferase/cobyric acid decarboxylase-like protein
MTSIAAMRQRLADLYGVDISQVAPVRGALHGMEIVLRLLCREGRASIAGGATPEFRRLASIYALEVGADGASAAFAGLEDRDAALKRAGSAPDGLIVIDESDIEFSALDSLCGETVARGDLIVIRSLEAAYGLVDAPCAALIAAPPLIARLEALIEPRALPPVILKAALEAVDPMRLPLAKQKIRAAMAERRRVAATLGGSPDFVAVTEATGAAICVTPRDAKGFLAALRAAGIAATPADDTRYVLLIGASSDNDRLLSAFDLQGGASPARRSEVSRKTLETNIVAIVDLDREGDIDIATGVGFFDHMLTQIAHHAGISATIACKGDLDVDAHHTIEDCAIAFGQALSEALGPRRGIARFGFVLPMDEAEAQISIDLGGRPYLVFEGEFSAPLIGRYPTEMTEHVFRSLSQSLGAAIRMSVRGANDHHKTEACFKAFGRALRQAVRVEGAATPSTKGVI